MATALVAILGLVGLALAVGMARSEPSARVRVAASAAAVAGFLIAFESALLTGKDASTAAAIGLFAAAVLPLVILGQLLILRAVLRRSARS